MLNVPGTPWENLGTTFRESLKTSEAIVREAGLDYTISCYPMSCEMEQAVEGYHAYYRNSDGRYIGVVNNRFPKLVQNKDAFVLFDSLLQNGTVSVECAMDLKTGVNTIVVFKINEKYKILGDDVQHYLVAVNNHLRPDGGISVFNTPVRLACMNVMSQMVSSSVYSMRMPVLDDVIANKDLASQIMDSADTSISRINKYAEKLTKIQISSEYVEKILDKLFPFMKDTDGEILQNKSNDRVAEQREQFASCMDAPNLANYEGTAYIVYQGFIDYAQHWFRSADRGYSLDYKMSLLPGVCTSNAESNSMVIKLLKMLDEAAVK